MSMLENFFDIRKNSRKLFEGLEIAEHQALCDAWMNQYPTISISFRQIDGLNFMDIQHLHCVTNCRMLNIFNAGHALRF